MLGNETAKHIVEAVNSEIEHGNNTHGAFKTNHDAFGVLKEEIEEAAEQIVKYNFVHEASLHVLWEQTKKDEVTTEKCSDVLDGIIDAALDTVGELIQVAAMCRKYEFMIAHNEAEVERDNSGE